MCAIFTKRSRVTSEAFWRAGVNHCPEGAAFAGDQRNKGSPSSGALFPKEEHSFKLREIQSKTVQEIEQLTLQLTKSHKVELQKVHQQADELRSAALSDRAQTHKQSLESLHNCIQMKDEEIKRLKEALEQHEEKMRRQAEDLKRETQEKIRRAVKREERKWEEQRDEALKEQRGTLEQQIEEAVRRGRIEVEKERRNALVLQSKVTELRKHLILE
ncbi:golgin subfamily A member 6-like protein 7 [Cyprinus carpio]|uniref:Golgin subfamily A member 6-like protein 7 n=1 Tax=Cyprinus carpio TaxID=7962 RepID=A0A9Q9ZZ31_CYPCA|nr:golgin subfamily A member 6-like protein 7 [Cyprinus carpio]